MNSLPKGHENYKLSDQNQCPYLQILKQKESKQQQTKYSGCPFIDAQQRNPSLHINLPFEHNLPYISALNSLLPYEFLQKFPLFLRFTLLTEQEEIIQLRKENFNEQLLAYEQLNQIESELWKSGKINEAVAVCGVSIGIFRWLEWKPVEKKQSDQSEQQLDQEQQELLLQGKIVNKKVQLFLGDIKEEEIYYHDMDNLEENNAKMMKSRLVQSYINLSVYLMQLGNYTDSLDALKEAEMINPLNSQLHYRKAQAISLNKDSSINQLLECNQVFQKASELLQQNEEFMMNKKGLIKALNLDKAEEDYQELQQFIEKRIKEEQEKQREVITKLIALVKKIQIEEKEFILSGELQEGAESKRVCWYTQFNQEEEIEFGIAQEFIILAFQFFIRIIERYLVIIQFFCDNQNKEEDLVIMENAKREYFEAKKVVQEVQFLEQLNLEDYQDQNIINEIASAFKIDIYAKQFQEKFKKVKQNELKTKFYNTNWNFDVYKSALNQFLQKKNSNSSESNNNDIQRKEMIKKFESLIPDQKNFRMASKFAFSTYYLIQFIGIALIFGIIIYYQIDIENLKKGNIWRK